MFPVAYQKQDSNTNDARVKCTYSQGPKQGEVCDVDISLWKPCVSEEHYNYQNHGPCIFLKLNKVNHTSRLHRIYYDLKL